MHPEYEVVLDSSPIRQGDVFQWLDIDASRPWKSYGVVVTADCDLANSKTAGRLSFVPALLAEDYLWHFWMRRKAENAHQFATAALLKRAHKLIKKTAPDNAPISVEALAFMIETHGDGLGAALGLTMAPDLEDFASLVRDYRNSRDLRTKEVPDLTLLRECYHLVCKKKEGDAVLRALVEDFRSSIMSLPGDVFHLPTVDGREDGGIFLMLRHITQCDLSDIAIRPSDVKFGDAKARRIARVAAPYRYSITQNLARVFADIGLPDAYSDRQKLSSELFFQSKVAK